MTALISVGIDVNQTEELRVRQEHNPWVDLPIIGVNVNGVNLMGGYVPSYNLKPGPTALHQAIVRENYRIIQMLVAAGANLELPYDQQTPLELCRRKRDARAAEILIRAGAKVDEPRVEERPIDNNLSDVEPRERQERRPVKRCCVQ